MYFFFLYLLPQNFRLGELILMILFLFESWCFPWGPISIWSSSDNDIHEKTICLKFALSMYATNGWITQYHANRFRWFLFLLKGYTSEVFSFKFGEDLMKIFGDRQWNSWMYNSTSLAIAVISCKYCLCDSKLKNKINFKKKLIILIYLLNYN